MKSVVTTLLQSKAKSNGSVINKLDAGLFRRRECVDMRHLRVLYFKFHGKKTLNTDALNIFKVLSKNMLIDHVLNVLGEFLIKGILQ